MSTPKILMKLEVASKQNYIFSTKSLAENASRSAQIAYVTSSAFFPAVAQPYYEEGENLVYAGGGHTVLQFQSSQEASNFAKAVSLASFREQNGLQLFVKQVPYDVTKTPSQNLFALSQALEKKKNLRLSSLGQVTLGIEGAVLEDSQDTKSRKKGKVPPVVSAPKGWHYPQDFEALSHALQGEYHNHFLAVIHIDGNAMGKRVEAVNKLYGGEAWETYRKKLQIFSQSIQKDFQDAFAEMMEILCESNEKNLKETLPLRPVILAGDDVCFVADGRIGLECARVYLEQLAKKTNQIDGIAYASCAGVALVHLKFPFFRAYQLSEQLCDNGKKYGASLNPDGKISAIDWHMEFGQMKNNLGEIRQDYETEDGKQLELRPLVHLDESGVPFPTTHKRSYAFFVNMTKELQKQDRVARGKLKEFRTALAQGEVESQFFLTQRQAGNLQDHLFEALHGENSWKEAYKKLFQENESLDRYLFDMESTPARSLYFDAIEMMDHCDFWEVNP